MYRARFLTTPLKSWRAAASRPLTSQAKMMHHPPNQPARSWKTAGLIMAAGLTYFSMLPPPIQAEAKGPDYPGAVEDPSSHLLFPVYLDTNNDWKRLIGLGVRQVSFLHINVYVLGLYMRSEDIGELQKDPKWKDFDKAEFLQKEDLAMSLLDQPIDVSVRIVPVRITSGQHLRDGFVKSLYHRMRSQHKTEAEQQAIIDGISEFSSKFTTNKIRKDTELVFTKTRKGELKMEYEGQDLGTVANPWVATNFIMTYLSPEDPVSEDALNDIAIGFDNLMHPSKPPPP